MRKSWLHGLALSLGLAGFATAFAQYPNANENFGLSSFPVQTDPQAYSPFQNLPQVPTGQVHSGAAQSAPSAYAPTGYGPPGYSAYGQQPAYAPSAVAPYATAATPHTSSGAIQQAGQSGAAGNAAAPQTYAAQPYTPQYAQQPYAQQPYAQHAPSAATTNGLNSHASQTGDSPYQLVGNQEYLGGNPAAYPQSLVPQPIDAPQAMEAPTASQLDYGYQPQPHSVAPNCSSCGPAPVSGAYPTSYSAPSPFSGFAGGHKIHQPLGRLPAAAKPWFFGGGVLLFNRIDNKNIPLSFADAVYAPDTLHTGDAQMGVMPGFEVMLGRYFNCGKNAIAASYWGLFPDSEQVERVTGMPGDLRSRIPFTYMVMPDNPTTGPVDPYNVYDWYDNAYSHVLLRSSRYHNVEVSLLGFAMGCSARNFNLPTCGGCGGNGCDQCGASKYATGPCCLTAPACGSRLNLSWLLGFRYFRFEDNLLYAASLQDSVVNRAADDLYYEVDTTNDLFGFQLGSRADYCVGKRLNLYGTAKAGIYGNHSTLYTRLGTDYQSAYLNDTRTPTNPSQGQNYLFSESKDSVAFLSELGAGLGLRVTSKWTATAGYRAVIACGVASAVDNFQTSFANYESIRDYHNFGCLVLHGVNIGATYNF